MKRLALGLIILQVTLSLSACGGSSAPGLVRTFAGLRVPEGFVAVQIAAGLDHPTSIAVHPDGSLFVSQMDGKIFRLGRASAGAGFSGKEDIVDLEEEVTGIAFSPNGSLYISSRSRVSRIREPITGEATLETIVSDLPHGLHHNNGLVFGPDGKLYVTNGSTCNDCLEEDERAATILQANPDGSDLRIYASGLRNSYDLVFDLRGRLWAPDNGTEPPCVTSDELNLITEGSDYGWPYGPACDRDISGVPPVATFGLHTAPTGIEIYNGLHFPDEYLGNLFITLWGSFQLDESINEGRILVRAEISPSLEQPNVNLSLFADGFLRPIDVLMDQDGSLLVLDYGSELPTASTGRIYRIFYGGLRENSQ